MTHTPTLSPRARGWLAASGVALAAATAAYAGPGAHGPNGEHLDAPAAAAGGSANPRIEASSGLFELVGTLAGSQFSILVDRYATNEPVLKADVELEYGDVKAKARFQADLGDYMVDDPALVKKLSMPGEHPLVITVLAGQDTDLLDGVLRVPAPVKDHAHDLPWRDLALGATGTATGALILGGLAWRWRRRRAARLFAPRKGGLA